MRRLPIAILSLLLAPAAAEADTYCVGQSARQGTHVEPIDAARTAVNQHPGPDRVEIGPGVFDGANGTFPAGSTSAAPRSACAPTGRPQARARPTPPVSPFRPVCSPSRTEGGEAWSVKLPARLKRGTWTITSRAARGVIEETAFSQVAGNVRTLKVA